MSIDSSYATFFYSSFLFILLRKPLKWSYDRPMVGRISGVRVRAESHSRMMVTYLQDLYPIPVHGGVHLVVH